MKPTLTTIDSRRIPWLRAAAVAASLVALALLAPMVWLAVTTGVGLLLLGSILAAAFVAMQALPMLGQKLENRLLAARKAEARRNPIEQLQNEVLRRAQRLQSFRKALVTVGGQIESISQMLVERRRKDPGQSLERHARALQRLQQFHGLNLGRLVRAHDALDEFRTTVERKESEWAIAIALAEANDVLDPHATDQLIQDLLTDTALRSVQDRFNTVFAELDLQMVGVDSPTRTLIDATSRSRMDDLLLPEQTRQRSHP